MKKLLTEILSEFKWYRKMSGGTWYYLRDNNACTGFAAPIEFWARDPGNLQAIEKEEHALVSTHL